MWTGNCLQHNGVLITFVLLCAHVVATNGYGQCGSCDDCDANGAVCDASRCDAHRMSLESACRRWESIKCGLEEECGIDFEGSVTNFYQGVSSGGLQRKFRYGGHAEYDFDLDLGKISGWNGFTLKLGSEHRFADTVNGATGSVAPVALAPNLPEPETDDLALIEVRLGYELSENLELFAGKLDTLTFDRNAFAHGNGDERFFSTPFNYNSIAAKTIPYSALGAGFNIMRDGQRVFTLGVLNSEETPTTVGISDLFAGGAVILSELRIPVRLLGRSGQHLIGGSWSSKTFTSLDQNGRIDFPDIPIAAKRGSWALSWNFDQFLWQDRCDPARGWGLFGRAGISDGNPNPIEWSLSFGVGGDSRIAGREDDRFGLGWYYLGLSDEFGPVLTTLLGDGQGVEMYYDIAVSERLRMTFDFQIVEPNTVGTDWALVPGIRAHIEL